MKNNYEIRGEVTAIFISCGDKVIETLIDTSDLPRAMELDGRWYSNYNKNINGFYVKGHAFKFTKVPYLHRWLFGDLESGECVDHINHDGLDNRRNCNLRKATDAQNKQNRKGNDMRGIKYSHGKWRARICINNKEKHLGCFLVLEDAKRIVREARATYLSYSQEALTQEKKDDDYFENAKQQLVKSSSGIKYVYWSKSCKKWTVEIKVNNKKHVLGFFVDIADAAKCAKEGANKKNLGIPLTG